MANHTETQSNQIIKHVKARPHLDINQLKYATKQMSVARTNE